jgi:myo-inositol-1(or 4)-monophosphatase
MQWFRSDPEVRHKTPDQPVTQADLAADALLRERLMGARPRDGWLSEETEDDPARLERERVWIVDPIDGTRSFIAGYREFAVSVALTERGRSVVGVLYNPALDEVVWATEGGGTYGATDWAGGKAGARRIRMAEPVPGERPMVLASRSEIADGEFEAFRDGWRIESTGSTAWKLAGAATGPAHAYISRGPKHEWDVAAGALIVAEAGGVVSDLDGAELRFNRADPYIHGILAATPALHRELLDLARDLPAPRLRTGRRRAETEGAREDR